MIKRTPAAKLFVIGVFVCAVIALLSSTTSAYRAPRDSRTAAAPKVELVSISAVDDPEAIYQGARVVHNVTVGGEKGMRVHAKFTVKYGLDVDCMLIAYFYYDDSSNTKLKTDDPNYRAKDGTVSAHTNFTPAYDPAVYNDLQIFIPYEALNMESGEEYDLKFYLALYDKEGGRFFGKSGWYKFHLTMP